MKYLYKIVLAACLACAALTMLAADGDNRTFTNPVVWADLPDPDVICVDGVYYFVSTSMHYMPGVTILQSTDLVNWQIACNVVDAFREHPYYDLNGGHRYAKGQWATSLRYFGGEFHVLFNTNTEGSFIYSSATMDGPWRKTKVEGHKLYDPGMFVDTDGRVYVIHGNTDIFCTELDPETLQEKGPAVQIFRSHRGGLEGNRCYKIGQYYYIYCTYGGDHAGQTCLRSRSLYGPWEEREVMFDSGNLAESILHQSCIIPTAEGEYWGMIFQDRVGLGRVPWLVPIYWVDQWPIMGNPTDGIIRLRLPLPEAEPIEESAHRALAGNDDFSASELALKWQFNHNPDTDKYSLIERPGYLRMKTASVTDSLLKARNTITQRIIGPYSTGTVKIDFSHQRVGDRSGLVILAAPFATLTVERSRSGRTLSMTIDEAKKETVGIKSTTLWLRAEVDGITDKVVFAYSTDGENFQPIGTEFQMEFTNTYFCGNRYGIFNYATLQQGGYIDVDGIQVNQRPLFSRTLKISDALEPEWADYRWNMENVWSSSEPDKKNQEVLTMHDGAMIAFEGLSFEESVNELSILLRNIDAVNTMLELRDIATGEVLSTVDIPEASDDYTFVDMPLSKPLPDCHRIELRVWNKDWNMISMGRVSIDKIMLK